MQANNVKQTCSDQLLIYVYSEHDNTSTMGDQFRQIMLLTDLQSCGGKTLITARNSWIADGGGEAVGRQ